MSDLDSSEPMNPGTNFVHWDGRDPDDGLATPGLCLVSVEALVQRRVQTLAVVR